VVEFKNETEPRSWSTLAARLSSPPVTVRGACSSSSHPFRCCPTLAEAIAVRQDPNGTRCLLPISATD
jgi:hypothetical protein